MVAHSSPKILVLGGGFVGLTTALELLESGYQVQITTSEITPWTTSDIAGALFEPVVGTGPEEKVREWSIISSKRFFEMSHNNETGIVVLPAFEYFNSKTPDPGWKDSVRRFRRLQKSEFPVTCPGLVDGWTFETLVLNPSTYMNWMWKRFFRLGGILKFDKVTSLQEVCQKSLGFSVVINCTGLYSRFLCQDPELIPVKGQVVRVWAPWVNHAATNFPSSGKGEVTYIIPRGDGTVVLGGLLNHNQWDTTVDDHVAKEIISRCQKLIPELGSAKIVGHNVGLRPYRKSIRVEKEEPKDSSMVPIIHNYGHGASGITLGWGCAEEVVSLVKKVVLPPSKL